jgi:nitroreductase
MPTPGERSFSEGGSLDSMDDPITRLRPLLRTRQYREFTGEPVSDEDLRALAQVARWSGSSRNSQPWRFGRPRGRSGGGRAAIRWPARRMPGHATDAGPREDAGPRDECRPYRQNRAKGRPGGCHSANRSVAVALIARATREAWYFEPPDHRCADRQT